jgi:uncharacterized repeat protein (TIGR03803 family)
MRNERFATALTTVLTIFAATLFAVTTRAAAQTETVLYNFNSSARSSTTPIAGLIFDSAGNLYGTASQGGAYGSGTVFELIPKAGGGWTEKNLHNFGADRDDGNDPYASLIFDAAGNLYGTTHGGGVFTLGTVFELSPGPGGGWTEKILYNFKNLGNGGSDAGLTLDAAGNLYGTELQGGAYGFGMVFELSPTSSGRWTETVLHQFGTGDAHYPIAGVIFDGAGNLYGTTSQGGNYDQGAVFELSPKAGGGWTEKILHHFNPSNGSDGGVPYSTLIFDTAGNLYGTTSVGGPSGSGTVFELTPAPNGSWTETILHDFSGPPSDGTFPYARLMFDGAGNLYGTTINGGPSNNCGTVFELSPMPGGSWTENILHEFDDYSNSSSKDGCGPMGVGGVVFDALGNLYGTTLAGGTYGQGTVFEIKP